jgi:type I restriction enzyme S subunit
MTSRLVRLGEVLTLKRGYDLAHRERKAGSVRVISSSGVTGFHDVAKVAAPGVVTGRYGTLGQVHFSDTPFWPLNTALYVVDFKGNDPRYCAALLESSSLANRSGAAAVPGLNRNDLHEILVTLQPLVVQRKVAAVLGAYDDLIKNNRRRIRILEEAIHLDFGARFDSIGPVAATGKRSTFTDLVEVNPTVPRPAGPVRYLPMDSLSTDDMTLGEFEIRDRATGVRFERGDTLMARITPSLENGKTGYVSSPEPGEVFCGSTEFIVMRGKAVSPEYTYCLARSERVRSVAIGSMSGATGRQRVSTACFDDLELIAPLPKADAAFSRDVRPRFHLIHSLARTNENLKAQRDALLPKLISGEIDLSELDFDTTRLIQQEERWYRTPN